MYFELRHACDWDGLDETEERLDALTRDAIERGIAPGEHAFIHIARIEDASANLQVARLHADGISRKLTRRGAIRYSHGSEPAPKRRMRLGYLSADFRDHAIGHLIAGLFAHHDRAGFEVIAYSHGDDDGSVLWLLDKNPLTQSNLRKEAESRGIEGERLLFAGRVPKPENMARTQLADLALDTGTYTGHVTTCNMLWAGLPVITRIRNHFASRVLASALHAAGLPELITESWVEFIALAIRLAQDSDARVNLRRRLEDAHDSAPLFDTARSIRALENGFREMWRLHCAGEQIQRIDIPDT